MSLLGAHIQFPGGVSTAPRSNVPLVVLFAWIANLGTLIFRYSCRRRAPHHRLEALEF
jgi:hypothetical protein